MNSYILTMDSMESFQKQLHTAEHCASTIEKYLRDVKSFAVWLGGRAVTKEAVLAWKEHLCGSGYSPGTVNTKLSAMNRFFRFMGWEDCRVKFLRIQRRLFRPQEKELHREEYKRLLETAYNQKKERLALLLETICATGIRVSEVRYITVEAAFSGRAEISLKGKVRVILLPNKLCRKLLHYAKKQKTASGEIFLTKSGKSLSRGQIWTEMKKLCAGAGINAAKVFPHNLRHLFATLFYQASKDIVKLADVLGHSSVETTRIYLLTAGSEHKKQMERLGLIS